MQLHFKSKQIRSKVFCPLSFLCFDGMRNKEMPRMNRLRVEDSSTTFVLAVNRTSEAEHVLRWVVNKMMRKNDTLKLIYAQTFSGRIHTDVVPLVQSTKHPRVSRSLNSNFLGKESIDLSKKFSQLCEELKVNEYTIEAVLEDIGVAKAICEYVDKLELIPGISSDNVILVLGQHSADKQGKYFFTKPENVVSYCVKHVACPLIIVKEKYLPQKDQGKYAGPKIQQVEPEERKEIQEPIEEMETENDEENEPDEKKFDAVPEIIPIDLGTNDST